VKCSLLHGLSRRCVCFASTNCMHSHHLLGEDDGILCVISIGGTCLDNNTFANGLNSMCVFQVERK
jgi:hypothetical protein